MCEVIGKLKVKKDEEQVSDNFKKRIFVVETEGSHPQTIQLELTQDRCDLIDMYNVGDSIKCHINIRGKEYTKPLEETKYFNTIVCWRIEKQ